MAHHHDDHGHGHNEQKPVSFTVPLILGAVTVLIIVLLVSLGNPKHHGECAEGCSKECMEACAKGDHSKHPEGMSMEECHKGMVHGEHGDMAAECPNCKEGKECAHHGKHAEEAAPVEAAKDSAAVETTEHTAEPAKEEVHH